MSVVYLFRHGQTEFNRDQKFTGWLDSKLTDLGRQQAGIIADLLAAKKIDLAYQTRLSRSQDTLKIVLKSHPECHRRITDDRIIERSYGDLAGLTHQEIIDGLGVGEYEQWHRGFYDHPPGGESFADVENRIMEFLAMLKSRYHQQHFGIAVSAHGNSIRLFRKILENASIAATVSWSIPYDKYFEFKI